MSSSGIPASEVVRVAFGHAHEEETDARPPAFSDEALALRFAERHEHRLRYVAVWSRWMLWDGQRWQPDGTLQALDFARLICREAAAQCNDNRLSAMLASAKTVAAVERLARADRRLAATVDQWDHNPWLLNIPDGTIDLRSGTRYEHQTTDYLTQMTAIAPGGGCPRWLGFLDRVCGSDADLVAYLQRVAGYFLTGSNEAHALFFLYGTGANGKSVFVNTVSGILGDYHRVAPIETFTVSSPDRHPTELAGLMGSRLVTATETEEGRRWAESRIKALTGGDKIAARFMRQDFFEFTPQFKLLIAGNHKPGLQSVDEAIRRRFHLIPFAVTIPLDERDEGLTEALKAEWSGILAWMIEGASKWRTIGLAPPPTVRAATEEYLEGEDAISAWIEERIDLDPSALTSTADLFLSWTDWARKSGEHEGSLRRFSQALAAKGHVPTRTNRRRGFRGLRVRDGGYGNPGRGWLD